MTPVGPLSMLAAAVFAIAIVYGGWANWLLWPALNFGGLAFAYSHNSPRPFGKRADGTLRGDLVVLYFPLHVLTWSVWHLWRIVTRESAFDRIDGTLIIGRRLLANEHSPDAAHFLDLTQKFAEPKEIRERAGYWSFPILDAAGPSPEALVDMALQLPPDRTLYVHCARGTGERASWRASSSWRLPAPRRPKRPSAGFSRPGRASVSVRPSSTVSRSANAC